MTDGSIDPASHASRQRWDTNGLKAGDRFAHYREAMCQTFMAITPEMIEKGRLSAVVETMSGTDGAVSRLNMTPHIIKRTPHDLSKMQDEYHQISFYVDANVVDATKDFQHVRKTGQIFVDYANKEFQFVAAPDSYISCIGVGVSKTFLKECLGNRWHQDTVKIERSLSSEALFHCFWNLHKRFDIATPIEIQSLHSAINFLLVADILGDSVKSSTSFGGFAERGLMVVIKQYIHNHIADESLSAAFVAAKNGISVRYVHKLFELHSETFGGYVRLERLRRIYADLLDARCSNMTIADIAGRWGLKDPVNFHRNFKARYGETPNQVRLTNPSYIRRRAIQTPSIQTPSTQTRSTPTSYPCGDYQGFTK